MLAVSRGEKTEKRVGQGIVKGRWRGEEEESKEEGCVGVCKGWERRAKVMCATPKRRRDGKQPLALRDECAFHWSQDCLSQGHPRVKVTVACGRKHPY